MGLLTAMEHRLSFKKGFWLFAITIGLAPIYLWSSGLPQVGHIFGGVWIAWTFLNGYWSAPGLVKWGALFSLYAGVTNLIVFGLHGDIHSLFPVLYYFYNVGLIGALVGTAKRFGYEPTFRLLFWVFLGWLLLQAALVLSGFARVFGGSRVMGTFNDPNQFAHWIVWAVIGVAISGFYLFRSLAGGWIALAVGSFLLVFSASRSGLLGMAALWFGLVLGGASFFMRGLLRGRFKPPRLGILILGGLALMLMVGSLLRESIRAELGAQAHRFLQRLSEGVDRGEENLAERGYDRLWKFPEYLLLGAGEGANQRWAGKTTFLGEIHSTPGGVLFYYGLPGALLFLAMLWSVWKVLPFWWLRVLLLAPLFYSLGTYNLRNSFFWIGLGMIYVMARALREEQRAPSVNKSSRRREQKVRNV